LVDHFRASAAQNEAKEDKRWNLAVIPERLKLNPLSRKMGQILALGFAYFPGEVREQTCDLLWPELTYFFFNLKPRGHIAAEFGLSQPKIAGLIDLSGDVMRSTSPGLLEDARRSTWSFLMQKDGIGAARYQQSEEDADSWRSELVRNLIQSGFPQPIID